MSSMAELAAERHAEPLADVTGFFEEILAEVSGWVPVLAELFADPARPPGGKRITTTMQPLAAALVQRGEWPVVGAGFVAADQAVADAAWHMAWWQGETMERLVLPALASASDAYMRREWFTKPMESGLPHVTGPYVDFLCTDEYTMTMTVPVAAAGRRVGVAGADVFVESLEPVLLPALKKLHPAAALVNHVGRVVVSADAQLAAGTLLAPGAVPAAPGGRPRWTSMPCWMSRPWPARRKRRRRRGGQAIPRRAADRAAPRRPVHRPPARRAGLRSVAAGGCLPPGLARRSPDRCCA